MRVASIVGTRPNLIKEYPIHLAFKERRIEEILIHTGQHYDREMSEIFFRDLNLPKPDFKFNLKKGRQGEETGLMLSFVEDSLIKIKPDVVLVYGDVNSTVAGALAAVKLKIPVAHQEAGLRSNSFYNPEEINRKIADILSETLFPHIKEAYDSLIKEGFDKKRVFLVGDLMKDSLLKVMEKYKIEPEKGNYHLITVHRQENTDNPKKLAEIVKALIYSKDKFKFPVHPRTYKRLVEFNLWDKLKMAKNVEILPPLGYLDFIKILAKANKCLTDSGGVRREAYILFKPVILLTDIIWVKEMIDCRWAKVADINAEKINHYLTTFEPSLRNHPNIFGDGKTAEKIADTLLRLYGGKKGPVLPRLSIVIPFYNEIETLPILFEKLDNLNNILKTDYRLEYVFVDDGSTDGTFRELKKKYKNRTEVKIIKHKRNLGFGCALRTGFSNASGEIILTVDADTNYNQLEIPTILSYLKPGVDIVTASPWEKGGAKQNFPFHRFIFSRTLSYIYRLLLKDSKQEVYTYTSGFRVYRKEVLEEVSFEANDFIATAEILIKAIKKGFKIVEYPTVVYERKYGRSKLKTLKTIKNHLKIIISLIKEKFKK